MRFHRSLVGAALALLIIVAVAATALAHAPKKGAKFKGTQRTSAGPIVIGKFHAPVSFKVSSKGTKVLAFKYGSLGCGGAGGFGSKNPFTFPASIHKIGPMSVSASGRFSAKNVKSVFTVSGTSLGKKFTSVTTTMSSITGKFKTAKKATGTINFSQSFTLNGKAGIPCASPAITWSAKAK